MSVGRRLLLLGLVAVTAGCTVPRTTPHDHHDDRGPTVQICPPYCGRGTR